MVHCIQEQASGVRGRSLFADGFMAADQFRQQFPDQFRLLTSVKLDFGAVGKDYLDYHLLSRHSTIKLDTCISLFDLLHKLMYVCICLCLFVCLSVTFFLSWHCGTFAFNLPPC